MPSAGVQTCADRKSTRLNSSHTIISYAVFCLKKKKDVMHFGDEVVVPGQGLDPRSDATPQARARVTEAIKIARNSAHLVVFFFQAPGAPQNLPPPPPRPPPF